MIGRLINWLRGAPTAEPHRPAQQRRRVSAHAALNACVARPPARPQGTNIDSLDGKFAGRIEDLGPGKNVLLREPLVSDDTGTQEMLSLLDDSPLDSAEPTGIDPYNSGQFDRSRYWDTRFRN
jgi:hypothetical protein